MDFFSRIPLGGADEYLLFTPTYFIAMIISLSLLTAGYILIPKVRNWKHEKYIRYFMVAYMIFTTINIWSFYMQNDLPWYAYIPVGTCGFSIFLAAYVLITKNRTAFVVLFFWGWGGFLAIFAPNILEGPDHYFFYQFYLRHILIVFSAIYMMRVFDYKVFRRDYMIYVCVTLPAALVGLGISYLINDPEYANVFFMMRPAVENTPLDFFYNIHPLVYTGFWILVAFLFGFLYGLPFFINQKKKAS